MPHRNAKPFPFQWQSIPSARLLIIVRFHHIHQVNGPDSSGLRSLLEKEQTKHLRIKSCIIIFKEGQYLHCSNHFLSPWHSILLTVQCRHTVKWFKSILYNCIFQLPLLQQDSYMQLIWRELLLKYQSCSSYWKIPLCGLLFFWHLKA